MLSPEVRRYALLAALAVLGYLLVWNWNNDYGQKPAESAEPVELAPDAAAIEDATGDDRVSDLPVASPDIPPASNDVPGQDFLAPQRSPRQEVEVDVGPQVEVSTPLLHLWIDRLGGDIVKLQLREYKQEVGGEDPVVLLDRRGDHVYIAQSGLSGRDGWDEGGTRPLYRASTNRYELDEGEESLEVVLTDERDGVTVNKRFRFLADDYLITVEHEIRNDAETPFQAQMFTQLKRDTWRPESGVPMGPRPFIGAAFTTVDDRYEKVDFDDVDERPFRTEIQGGWAAVLQHYFVSAWAGDPMDVNAYFARRLPDGNYGVGFVSPEVIVPPGTRQTVSAGLYAGPKIQRRLEEVAPHLNLTVDYGFLWWLSLPLFHVLDAIHSVVANWGVAIILLTFAVKLLLYPLASASYRSMAKLKKVAPQMKRLQERHAGDRQKLSQEMMALYKREGANPLGGCLPLLVQMPVFLALYWVLLESVELRQAPFFLWINDLSAADPWLVLPILYGASFFVMQLLQPPPPDPMQARIMRLLPIVFTVLFVFFPAGLVLYWLVNNLLSLAQQWYITRKIEKASS